MTQRVSLPNGSYVDFPDDMSVDEMNNAIYDSFPEFAPEKYSEFGAIGRGFRNLAQSYARAGLSALETSPAKEEAVKSLHEGMKDEYAPPSILSKEYWQSPISSTASLVGEQIPQLGMQAATAKLLGPLGMYGSLAGQFYGSNLLRQDIANQFDIEKENRARAAIAAAPQTASESLLGVGRFITKGATEGLGKEVLKTLMEEPLQEAFEQGAERYAAKLPLANKEALREYGESAAAAALLAPMFGSIGHYAGKRNIPEVKTIDEVSERNRLEELARMQEGTIAPKQLTGPNIFVGEQPDDLSNITPQHIDYKNELDNINTSLESNYNTLNSAKNIIDNINNKLNTTVDKEEKLLLQERKNAIIENTENIKKSSRDLINQRTQLMSELKKIEAPIQAERQRQTELALQERQKIAELAQTKKPELLSKEELSAEAKKMGEYKPIFDEAILNENEAKIKADTGMTSDQLVKRFDDIKKQQDELKKIYNPKLRFMPEQENIYNKYNTLNTRLGELRKYEPIAREIVKQKTAAEQMIEAKKEIAVPEVKPVVAEPAKQVTEPQVVKPQVEETQVVEPAIAAQPSQMEMELARPEPVVEVQPEIAVKQPEALEQPKLEGQPIITEEVEQPVIPETTPAIAEVAPAPALTIKATPAEVKSAQTVADIDNLLNNKKLTKIQTEALTKRKAKLSEKPAIKETAEFKPLKNETVVKKLDDNHVIVDKVVKNRHEYSEHVYDKNNKKWEKTENIHDNPAKVEQEHKETQELLAKRGLKEAGQTEIPLAVSEKAPEAIKPVAETYETKKTKVELGKEISVENADKLKSALNSMVGDKVALKFVDFINSISKESGEKLSAEGTFISSQISKGAKDLIAIVGSTEKNIADVIPHETMHFLKRSGVLSKPEWNILSQAAFNNNWVDKHDIINRYVKSGQIAEDNINGILEESIAEEFREFYNTKKEAPQSIIGKIFGKLKDFINGLKNHFANNKEDYQEIFDKITAGDYAVNENIIANQTGQEIKVIPEATDETASSTLESITGEDTTLEVPADDLIRYYLSQSKVKDLLGESAYKTDVKLTPQIKAEYDALVDKAWTKITDSSTPEQREIFKGVPKMERSDVLRAVIKMNDRGDIISDFKSYEQLDNSIKEIIPEKLFPVLQGANELYNSFRTPQIDRIGLVQWLETPYSVFKKSLQGSRLFNSVKDMHTYSRAIMAKQSDKISGIFKGVNDKDVSLLNKYLHEKRTDVNKATDKKAASAALKANEDKGIFRFNDGTELSKSLHKKVLDVRELFKDTLKPFQEAVAEELKVNPEDITPKFIEKYLDDKKGNTKQLKIAAGMKSVFDKLSPENMDYSYVPNMRFGRNYIMVTDKTAKTSSGEPMPLYFERFDYESMPELLESAAGELFGSTIGNKATDNKRNKLIAEGWTDHRTGEKIKFDPEKHSIETGINNPIQFNAPEYDESIESLQRIVAAAQGVDTASGDILAKAIQDFIDEQNVNSSIFKEFHDVPGYSEDLIKVVNSYNFKIGYLVSNLKHGYDVADSYRQIQKTNNRDLIEYTDKYLQGLKSKDKSVFRIARTIGFINALGFNPSSAVMNYFHMPLVAMPYLKSIGMKNVKFGEGFANSLKGLTFNKEQALYFDVNKLNISEKDKDLLRKYAVSPEFSLLYGLPEGTEGLKSAKIKGARRLQGIMNYAASFLKASEDHMRASSFLSLLNSLRSNPEQLTQLDKRFSQDPMYLAKKNKDGLSPEVMASFLSDRMMFVGGNINKAPWERGLLGMVTQFKHYPASVIQLYGDMFRDAKIDNQAKAGLAIALFGLMAASGYNGLPFGEDILSMISSALKAITGRNINVDAEIRKIADSIGGPTFAQILSKGALDVSGLSLGPRIGMGRMLPQSTKFKDLVGPAGAALYAPVESLQMMRTGFDPLASTIAVSPVAIKNIGTGLYLYPKYGATTKTGTQILTPEEMTIFDSAVKILGFNPQKVAQKQAESSAIYEATGEESSIKTQTHKALARLLVEKTRLKNPEDKANKQKEIDKIYNKAREKGLQLNGDSIKRYILQIQNPEAYRMKYTPKKKRQKVEEIKRLY